jgi:hypothetical protein
MSKVYKIHPGIGIARVGKSTAGYFLAGEAPSAGPFDIGPDGRDMVFGGYKDSGHIIRRQGVRFRVFEYDKNDATGDLTLTREITSAEAKIDWTVQLAAAKSAGQQMQQSTGPDGVRTVAPGAALRNTPPPGFTAADLRAEVTLTATGSNTTPMPGAAPMGRIIGQDLFIGEARTDASGRLIVLAGHGVARSWLTPAPDIGEFLNNPGWYDDIADGPVDAKVTFAGTAPVDAIGAWVITTPPDFAPDIAPLTTLYDIVQQATGVPLPARLTYPQDIQPILRRAADLFFVSSRPVWKSVHDDLLNSAGLSDNGPAAATRRRAVRDDVRKAQVQMDSYRLTQRQTAILEQWVQGNFDSAADATRPAQDVGALLDRACLERCVGGGFFPGIEAGTILRQPTIYVGFARLTRGTFTDQDGSTQQMAPGLLSQRMACPWQADFTECLENWWPSQRPDLTGRIAGGAAGPRWDRGIIVDDNPQDPRSHLNMVNHFAQLGLVVATPNGGMTGFVETGRDPALGTGA